MPDYNLVTVSMPNIYGMHENGSITIYLSNYRYNYEDYTISQICKILLHETLHYAIRCALSDTELELCNQELVIGKIIEIGR